MARSHRGCILEIPLRNRLSGSVRVVGWLAKCLVGGIFFFAGLGKALEPLLSVPAMGSTYSVSYGWFVTLFSVLEMSLGISLVVSRRAPRFQWLSVLILTFFFSLITACNVSMGWSCHCLGIFRWVGITELPLVISLWAGIGLAAFAGSLQFLAPRFQSTSRRRHARWKCAGRMFFRRLRSDRNVQWVMGFSILFASCFSTPLGREWTGLRLLKVYLVDRSDAFATEINLGQVQTNAQVQSEIRLKNGSASPITVIGGSATCSCISGLQFPLTIGPGEVGQIGFHVAGGPRERTYSVAVDLLVEASFVSRLPINVKYQVIAPASNSSETSMASSTRAIPGRSPTGDLSTFP